GPGDLFGFWANFLYGLVPYLVWEAMTDAEPVPRSVGSWVGLLLVIALAATLCATVVGWGLQALGFHPFTVLGTLVLVNNLGVARGGLGCAYPGTARPALAALDLELPPGALAVVMGASGAGKSTLARCLTRLVPCFVPAEVTGDVRLLGEPIHGRRVGELAGTIGMVFQDFEAQLFS